MNSTSPPSKYDIDKQCSLFIGPKFLEINLHGGVFDVPTVDRILGKIEEYTGGRNYLTIINCERSASTTFKCLRRMGQPSAMQYARAKGYVIHTLHQRMMANIYLLIFRPKKPVRFFRNETDARQWLETLNFY